MEHRCGSRHKVDLRAVLRVNPRVAVQAKVRELSVSGAWLQCQSASFINSIVTVELNTAGHNGRSKPMVIEATVGRQTNDGGAIEWGEFAPEWVLSLLQGSESVLSTAEATGGRLSNVRRA